MKNTLRKHGKWLFVPAPILILLGSTTPFPSLIWAGLALLGTLVAILAIMLMRPATE